MEYCAGQPGSVRLDAGELHHLAPLLNLIRDELAEIGWRAHNRNSSQVGEPNFHLGIGESGVDLLIELVDDLGRRALGAPIPYHPLAS